jgi:hypothetical protein
MQIGGKMEKRKMPPHQESDTDWIETVVLVLPSLIVRGSPTPPLDFFHHGGHSPLGTMRSVCVLLHKHWALNHDNNSSERIDNYTKESASILHLIHMLPGLDSPVDCTNLL